MMRFVFIIWRYGQKVKQKFFIFSIFCAQTAGFIEKEDGRIHRVLQSNDNADEMD